MAKISLPGLLLGLMAGNTSQTQDKRVGCSVPFARSQSLATLLLQNSVGVPTTPSLSRFLPLIHLRLLSDTGHAKSNDLREKSHLKSLIKLRYRSDG